MERGNMPSRKARRTSHKATILDISLALRHVGVCLLVCYGVLLVSLDGVCASCMVKVLKKEEKGILEATEEYCNFFLCATSRLGWDIIGGTKREDAELSSCMFRAEPITGLSRGSQPRATQFR